MIFRYLQVVFSGYRGAVTDPCADYVQGVLGRQFGFPQSSGTSPSHSTPLGLYFGYLGKLMGGPPK